MPLELYISIYSPPSRAVWMTCRALGLEPNVHFLDMSKGEHKTEEYLKMNPAGQVPTLIDDGFVIFESRAVMQYLADKYGSTDTLFPKDHQRRARLECRLLKEMQDYGTLGEYIMPLFSGKEAPEGSLEKVKEVLDGLDKHLEGRTYLAGDDVTLCDISQWCCLSGLIIVGFDMSPWKNLSAWEKRVMALPYFEECNKGFLDAIKQGGEAKEESKTDGEETKDSKQAEDAPAPAEGEATENKEE